jgi:hypothetical protein
LSSSPNTGSTTLSWERPNYIHAKGLAFSSRAWYELGDIVRVASTSLRAETIFSVLVVQWWFLHLWYISPQSTQKQTKTLLLGNETLNILIYVWLPFYFLLGRIMKFEIFIWIKNLFDPIDYYFIIKWFEIISFIEWCHLGDSIFE